MPGGVCATLIKEKIISAAKQAAFYCATTPAKACFFS
jgi:hypothetical protein